MESLEEVDNVWRRQSRRIVFVPGVTMKYIVLCLITIFPNITFGEDPLTERSYEGCKAAAKHKAESMAPRFSPEVTVSCDCTSTDTALKKGIINRGELKRSTPGSI